MPSTRQKRKAQIWECESRKHRQQEKAQNWYKEFSDGEKDIKREIVDSDR